MGPSASTVVRGCRSIVLLFATVVAVACARPAFPPDVADTPLETNVEVVASGFTMPWGIAVIGEDEYVFSDRIGTLYHYRAGRTVALEGAPETFTVEDRNFIWGGLMDVSLHPQFETNGLVYIAYVNAAGRLAVARFNFSSRTIRDLAVIFESNAFSIGSALAWEDDDHFFVSQGMGGDPRPEPGAQDLAHDAGKIHRLLADGSIPSDNPVFDGRLAPTSIWSYGHRNPQGLFVDRERGAVYSSEFGPRGGDEFNVISKGGNYGWPLFSFGLNYDGTRVSDLTTDEAARTTILPVTHWTPTIGPTGITRVKGDRFPAVSGAFLFGSLPLQGLFAYDLDSRRTSVLLKGVGRVRDVAELPSGNLLLLVESGSPRFWNSGRILKLTPR